MSQLNLISKDVKKIKLSQNEELSNYSRLIEKYSAMFETHKELTDNCDSKLRIFKYHTVQFPQK